MTNKTESLKRSVHEKPMYKNIHITCTHYFEGEILKIEKFYPIYHDERVRVPLLFQI